MPDGNSILSFYADGRWKIMPINGGAPRNVQGLLPEDEIHQVTPDGRFAYAEDANGPELKEWKIDLDSGERKLFKDLKPPEAGVYVVYQFAISRDGRSYAYVYGRELSTLYEADHLR
jgi:hypothetical protein